MAATSEVTPVAVSLCVTSTALILRPLSAASAARYRSTGAPSPQSHSSTWVSKPRRWHMSIHRCENWPKRDTSTMSPGHRQLVSAASQQPVPEDGKMKGVPVSVLNTFFRPERQASVSLGNLGERWSSIGTTMARSTRSGMLVGPGTKRPLRPAMVCLLWVSRKGG